MLSHVGLCLQARLPSVPSATKPTLGGKPAADALLDLVPRQPQWAGTRDALLTVLTGRRYFANKVGLLSSLWCSVSLLHLSSMHRAAWARTVL